MSRQPRPHTRTPREEARNTRAYRQLWRVVDGAVFDALYTHQDYLTPKGQRAARMSINKRVVGAVLGFAEQSARGRSGEIPAAERDTGLRNQPLSRTVVYFAVSKWRTVTRTVRQLFARAA